MQTLVTDALQMILWRLHLSGLVLFTTVCDCVCVAAAGGQAHEAS